MDLLAQSVCFLMTRSTSICLRLKTRFQTQRLLKLLMNLFSWKIIMAWLFDEYEKEQVIKTFVIVVEDVVLEFLGYGLLTNISKQPIIRNNCVSVCRNNLVDYYYYYYVLLQRRRRRRGPLALAPLSILSSTLPSYPNNLAIRQDMLVVIVIVVIVDMSSFSQIVSAMTHSCRSHIVSKYLAALTVNLTPRLKFAQLASCLSCRDWISNPDSPTHRLALLSSLFSSLQSPPTDRWDLAEFAMKRWIRQSASSKCSSRKQLVCCQLFLPSLSHSLSLSLLLQLLQETANASESNG